MWSHVAGCSPRDPHLESRVPRHTEPQARCASPPHRRPTFARSCTRWGWARRRAARWPCSRASRGSTTSRTLYKPRMSLRSEADFFGLLVQLVVSLYATLTRHKQVPTSQQDVPTKPNHYSTAFSTHVENVPAPARAPAPPRPRGPWHAAAPGAGAGRPRGPASVVPAPRVPAPPHTLICRPLSRSTRARLARGWPDAPTAPAPAPCAPANSPLTYPIPFAWRTSPRSHQLEHACPAPPLTPACVVWMNMHPI